MDWLVVVNAVLVLLAAILGWRLRAALRLLREAAEFAVFFAEAAKDGISKQERDRLIKEAKDVVEALERLTNKQVAR